MTLRIFLLGMILMVVGNVSLMAQTPCVADAGPDFNLCLGTGQVVGADTALPGQTYTWSVISGAPINTLNPPNAAQPIASPGITTIYQLVVDNPTLMCSDTDTVIVTVTQPFSVTHWTDSTICLGQTISFDIEPGVNPPGIDYTYTWQSSNGDSITTPDIPNPSVTPPATGIYQVTVEDTFTNCIRIQPIVITVIPMNVFVNPAAEVVNPGQWVQLEAFATNANGEVTWTWSPDVAINNIDIANPEVRPLENTTYTVTGVDTLGCIGTASATIVMDSLLIPNVFSPNGDGINDELRLNYWGSGNYEILIFDRWGNEVFQTTDTETFWDGRNNGGEAVPEGVYYMAVRILGDGAIPNKDKQKAFPIHLVR